MLGLALRFELRALVRSRAGLIAVFAFLAVGAIAILVGQRHVSTWQYAIAAAQQAQFDSTTQARRFFERGDKGPKDRPWVDLTQAPWQDRYSATRVVREPGPLAGIAAGAVDSAPVAFQVSAAADPLASNGYRIENPELDAGAVDLVFVLAVLAPLLVGVLGVEIGSRERQEGMDRAVLVQAGTLRQWLIARMLAVTIIAGSVATALSVVAGLVGGAGWLDIATLVGFTIANAFAWSGLMLAVNAYARSVRGAAFTFGTAWTLLCVLLPAIAAEVSLSRVESDFAVADTLGARSEREKIKERDLSSVLRELYTRHPELERLPAARGEPSGPKVARHAHDLLLVAALAERHRDRREQERRAQGVSERAAWFTPVVAMGVGLERLAGVGPEAASGYREYLLEAVEQRAHWVVTKAWTNEPLTGVDFDALVREAPTAYGSSSTGWMGPAMTLVIWGLASWFVALLALARSERSVIRQAQTHPRG